MGGVGGGGDTTKEFWGIGPAAFVVALEFAEPMTVKTGIFGFPVAGGSEIRVGAGYTKLSRTASNDALGGLWKLLSDRGRIVGFGDVSGLLHGGYDINWHAKSQQEESGQGNDLHRREFLVHRFRLD